MENPIQFNAKPTRRTFLAAAGTTVAATTLLAGADYATAAQTSAPTEPQAPAPPEQTGASGELHEAAGGTHPNLTTNQGLIIADDENQLKLGPRGPVLLEDFIYREKINHFDHEVIPERVVHARGSAAHGYFELTHSLSDISKADIFQRVGEKTPVFVRFSIVGPNRGGSDLYRDVRGFAIKHYTKEGNWDVAGNNIPVFFIQDALKFPDLIHSQKQEPNSGFPQGQTAHNNFWDFVSLTPESTHMLMWIMSDRTIPRGYPMMEAFGVHTFRLVNASGKSTYVKFHWRPKAGMQSVVWDEALKINGADPDYHRKDLWNAIEAGKYPEWGFYVQAFDEEFARKFDFDVLDPTKLIPEEIVPLRLVGRVVLDRNPDNFFAETEQVAYCPSHIVPGIDFTNDPLLQGRLFSYLDTQITRLGGGPNFHELPINAAKCPIMNFQRDGRMQMKVPKGSVNYSPSSLLPNTERENPTAGLTTYPSHEAGDKLRTRPESFSDHYSQARQFFYSQTETEQNHIIAAFTFELSKVSVKPVRNRVLGQLNNVDPKIAQRVAANLGSQAAIERVPARLPARTDLKLSPALSILAKFQPTLQGRMVGCLIDDGTDPQLVASLRAATMKTGAMFKVIAPKVDGAKGSDGKIIDADFQLAGGPSVLFDAVILALTPEAAQRLAPQPAAVSFVTDAYSHLKVIGHTPGAMPLITKAGAMPDAGIIALNGSGDAFLAQAAKGRIWAREPQVRPVA